MAYNEALTQRVRDALAHLPQVEETKMMRGVLFMVDGKMCVSTGDDELMCRINPALHEQALKRKGVRPVLMKGKEYKGYVYVNQEGMGKKKEFDYWIGLALEYNKIVKASPRKKKK
jgi:TfoX/Sxy family transcriptional regulator of competence genes